MLALDTLCLPAARLDTLPCRVSSRATGASHPTADDAPHHVWRKSQAAPHFSIMMPCPPCGHTLQTSAFPIALQSQALLGTHRLPPCMHILMHARMRMHRHTGQTAAHCSWPHTLLQSGKHVHPQIASCKAGTGMRTSTHAHMCACAHAHMRTSTRASLQSPSAQHPSSYAHNNTNKHIHHASSPVWFSTTALNILPPSTHVAHLPRPGSAQQHPSSQAHHAAPLLRPKFMATPRLLTSTRTHTSAHTPTHHVTFLTPSGSALM